MEDEGGRQKNEEGKGRREEGGGRNEERRTPGLSQFRMESAERSR